MFAVDDGTVVRIDGAQHHGISRQLERKLRRYRLAYTVSTVPHIQTVGWEGYEDCVVFRFQAADFPDLVAYSANNPDSI